MNGYEGHSKCLDKQYLISQNRLETHKLFFCFIIIMSLDVMTLAYFVLQTVHTSKSKTEFFWIAPSATPWLL